MCTVPRLPTTMRTISDQPLRGGMKSISVTAPSGVSKSVSRIRVSPRYRRVMVGGLSETGEISQRPLSGVPSRAAKHAPESKRGQQSQSTEPSREMSAAVWPSPISA